MQTQRNQAQQAHVTRPSRPIPCRVSRRAWTLAGNKL